MPVDPKKTAPPFHLRSRRAFALRALRFAAFAFGFLFVSLGAGTLGYHLIVGLPWIDSLLNASMILTGMGPVNQMPDDRSKLFASAYAIFSGAVYPAFTAIILYPFLHRMLAIFHLRTLEGGKRDD
ncbi:MAG: hypothetical protein JSR87_07105 [Proteobacteria bacterium]|nr:hypothetical protein [Pseudomonadota bacterium]MBS0572472.1 hypothetical protein [Pseudomonadota bacterium]